MQHQHVEGTPLPDATGGLLWTMECLPSGCSSMLGRGLGGTPCGKMGLLKWKKDFHM